MADSSDVLHVAAMAEHWIDARTALRIAGDAQTLCKRLHSGLVTAKAATFVLDGQRGEGVLVPAQFWWAEGNGALEQNWEQGDFATWINRDQRYEAFGVTFALSGLLQTVPHDDRAALARSISVASKPEWLTAKEARRLVYGEFGHNPFDAAPAILEQARLGFITGRAVMAQGTDPRSNGWAWEEREWPIEQWFWDQFTHEGGSSQDWELGRFSGNGRSPSGLTSVTLTGVHFLRRSLDALSPKRPQQVPESDNKRGRKPTYDWDAANTAIWGKIYRAELIPDNQAQIERAFQKLLQNGDSEPSESTVRPYANRVWEEFKK